MPKTPSFPAELRKIIIKHIKTISDNKYDRQDFKKILFTPPGIYEMGVKPEKYVSNFIADPEIAKQIEINTKFCSPEQFYHTDNVVSLGFRFGDSSDKLINIVDDFVKYSIRKYLEIFDEKKLLEDWNRFEHDFFSDKVEVRFVTQLANTYDYTGGDILNIIPYDKVSVTYGKREDLLNIRSDLKSAGKLPCRGELYKNTNPILITVTLEVYKNQRLENCFRIARDVIDKIVFVTRLILGGPVHYGFIKAIFLGNYCTSNRLVQTFQVNHKYINCKGETSLKNGPFAGWIRNILVEIKDQDYSRWQFANQKLRDSYERIPRKGIPIYWDKEYEMYRNLERMVDIIQALESIIGDKFKLPYTGEYVGKIIEPDKPKEIADDIKNLYNLRHKYMHGVPTGGDSIESIYQKVYNQDMKLLSSKIDQLEIWVKRILLFSIVNPDLRQKLEDYHESVQPKRVSTPVAPTTPLPFPQFKTIYK